MSAICASLEVSLFFSTARLCSSSEQGFSHVKYIYKFGKEYFISVTGTVQEVLCKLANCPFSADVNEEEEITFGDVRMPIGISLAKNHAATA